MVELVNGWLNIFAALPQAVEQPDEPRKIVGGSWQIAHLAELMVDVGGEMPDRFRPVLFLGIQFDQLQAEGVYPDGIWEFLHRLGKPLFGRLELVALQRS